MLLGSISSANAADFSPAAESEVRRHIQKWTLEHYDVDSVSILEVENLSVKRREDVKRVVAAFDAKRNDVKTLHPQLYENCKNQGHFYLLCLPKGHKFEGKLEVEITHTPKGWRILENYQSLQTYPLSRHLLLEGRQKEGYVLPPRDNDR
jgi:hypothetical protein